MLGLSPKDTWMVALLVFSGLAFWAAARHYTHLAGERVIAVSVGFSLGFVLLALVAGLQVLH